MSIMGVAQSDLKQSWVWTRKCHRGLSLPRGLRPPVRTFANVHPSLGELDEGLPTGLGLA